MALSPASSHGGGTTYTPPTTANLINQSTTAIANGATASLPWDGTGGTLINAAAPTAPTIIVAGIYSITATVSSTAPLTAGGSFTAALEMDTAGTDGFVEGTGYVTAVGGLDACALTLVQYCQAGAVLNITVTNNDGVASRTFAWTTVIQRIT